ncbi:hypothetical protein D3C78_1777350 [compost metagenome]
MALKLEVRVEERFLKGFMWKQVVMAQNGRECIHTPKDCMNRLRIFRFLCLSQIHVMFELRSLNITLLQRKVPFLV